MKKNSFTLLEVIFSITILVLTITGSFTLISRLLTFSPQTQSKLIASYLAQEGIEIVRNIRDTNWLESSSNPWDENLTTCHGVCDESIGNGCIIDYNTPNQTDPDLAIYNGEYLKVDEANGLYSYSAPTLTKFKRKVVIFSTDDILTVCVRVDWEEKGKKNEVKVVENLYNWR